jgi:hypothetical protein
LNRAVVPYFFKHLVFSESQSPCEPLDDLLISVMTAVLPVKSHGLALLLEFLGEKSLKLVCELLPFVKIDLARVELKFLSVLLETDLQLSVACEKLLGFCVLIFMIVDQLFLSRDELSLFQMVNVALTDRRNGFLFKSTDGDQLIFYIF